MPSGLVEINKDKEVKFKGYVQLQLVVYTQAFYCYIKNLELMLMCNMAELCAAKGHGICTDLFWRELPGCELNSDKKDDLEQASKLVKSYNIDKGYEDVVVACNKLRNSSM